MVEQTWTIRDPKYLYTRTYTFKVSETAVDPINNTSVITWKVTASGIPSTTTVHYPVGPISFKVNGTTVYALTGQQQNNQFPCVNGSSSGTITVTHNANGTKTIAVAIHLESATPIASYDDGGNVTLTAIDRTAPTVSIAVSNVGVSSCWMTITASETCDKWGYSTDNGSTWTAVTAPEGTSATFTIPNLASWSTFNVKGRARKKSNGVYGSSAATTIYTKGYTILNSVSPLTIDDASPLISLNWSVYDSSYTHSLTIKSGSTTILTITDITGVYGTGTKTIPLTSAQRSTLLAAMTTVKILSVTYTLTTYDSGTSIGTGNPVTSTLVTTAANSAPTFTAFTYADTNASTVAVTNDDQKIIQGQSFLTISYSAATPKNGATIVGYKAVIGNKDESSTTTSIAFGTVSSLGTSAVRVTATDSRGYETTVTANVAVIPYDNITISGYEAHRINNTDSLISMSVEGGYSAVYIGTTKCNSLQHLKYRTKRVDGSWSAYTNISSVTESGTSFSYTNTAWITLDSEYEYNIELVAEDKLTSSSVVLYIPKGKPLMSFRFEKVGINTNAPQSALDVSGNIMMNGQNVQGFVKALTSIDDLNDITASGIYHATVDNGTLNYPTSDAGILEVIYVDSALILQRFTTAGGSYYMRIYTTAWSAWKIIIA